MVPWTSRGGEQRRRRDRETETQEASCGMHDVVVVLVDMLHESTLKNKEYRDILGI